MTDSNSSESPTRRRFFKTMSIVPVAVAGLPGCSERPAGSTAPPDPSAPYKPAFFNAVEWAFLLAACDRLIPKDDIGPSALEAGVPEFIDRHMQTPYAAGDIWYMQGPFLEAAPEFGYQGRLPVREILRVGIKAIDAHCASHFSGKTFAQLDTQTQETLLKAAESGKLALTDVSAKLFFGQLLGEARMGYFCDPKHGGNKHMSAWKMICYPGMRADYIDWVGVRDKPYPLPPVDLSGKRG